MISGLLYGFRFNVWNQVYCMKCGLLYGFRFMVWVQVYCMDPGVLSGSRFGSKLIFKVEKIF